jgi:hypothetical protein
MRTLRLMVAVLGVLFAFGTRAQASASSASVLPVQGYLTDDNDVPLNGVYQLSFALFGAGSGGASIFTSTDPVLVSKGRFTVYLGDKSQLKLDEIHAALELWLEVTIQQSCGTDINCGAPTPLNKTLSPRLQLGSTAFAASATYCGTADKIGGIAAADLQSKMPDVMCGANEAIVGIQGGAPVCGPAAASGGAGTKGDTGAQGPAGAQGPKGDPGDSLASSGGTVNGSLTVTGTLGVGLYRAHSPTTTRDGLAYIATCDKAGYYAISAGIEPQTGGSIVTSIPLDGGSWRVLCADKTGAASNCGYLNLVCARMN